MHNLPDFPAILGHETIAHARSPRLSNCVYNVVIEFPGDGILISFVGAINLFIKESYFVVTYIIGSA